MLIEVKIATDLSVNPQDLCWQARVARCTVRWALCMDTKYQSPVPVIDGEETGNLWHSQQNPFKLNAYVCVNKCSTCIFIEKIQSCCDTKAVLLQFINMLENMKNRQDFSSWNAWISCKHFPSLWTVYYFIVLYDTDLYVTTTSRKLCVLKSVVGSWQELAWRWFSVWAAGSCGSFGGHFLHPRFCPLEISNVHLLRRSLGINPRNSSSVHKEVC